MNAAERAALDEIPVPVANGQAGRACVVIVGGGWYVAWLNGTTKQPFGAPYPTARAAAAASRHLNERGGA